MKSGLSKVKSRVGVDVDEGEERDGWSGGCLVVGDISDNISGGPKGA